MTRKQFDYVPTEIEPKWQKKWLDKNLFYVENDSGPKPKKFVLEIK